ncbi:HTH binding domain protein [Mycobacterium phage Spartacus]|uniref:DUF7241 domain-containing protein n=1 Tax=Mycobacterium phage Spartacus TaxID=1147141 RepID=H6WSI5_9CAUD|nr:HTH binding domain protein [Mycobacterium phage Spartacus]AFA45091.1 hypothetical protein SPARTACUS_83 [Mycobacterium phage Spartacus]
MTTPSEAQNVIAEVVRAYPMERGMSDADTARRNGWTVGTRLAGDEGRGETTIEITAIGEEHVLAKTISHAGRPVPYGESLWTFMFRDWREVPR